MINRNSWCNKLPHDVYLRLCECRNIKSDIEIMVDARWAWMKEQEKYKGYTKEDALVYVLEQLDANSQWQLADLTVEEYNELKSE